MIRASIVTLTAIIVVLTVGLFGSWRDPEPRGLMVRLDEGMFAACVQWRAGLTWQFTCLESAYEPNPESRPGSEPS